MQEYIEGYVFSQNTFEDSFLFESSKILGKINRSLANINFLPEGFTDSWFLDWDVNESINKHKLIRSQIKQSNLDNEKKDLLLSACNKKINMLQAYSCNYSKYCKLTRMNSHGDYNNLQLICDKSGIKSVIDFSSAASVPIVWEIIRSYTYCAKECINGNNINLNNLKKYITNYLSVNHLSLFDISNMCGFYYFNLLRSAYGLNSTDENIIRFAVWRTNMCEYLGETYRELDQYLRNEFKFLSHPKEVNCEI